MINNIIDILKSSNIDGWLINDIEIESSELFFVKDKLDMNRRKNVHHIEVTVYKDFTENDVLYKGSSKTKISPTMSTDEIKELIETAAYAASFVKNKHYDLVEPSDEQPAKVVSKFYEKELSEWLPGLVDAIYNIDKESLDAINSTEFFINKNNVRTINSLGVDVSYTNYTAQVELITEWNEPVSVELFEVINFSDYKPDQLTDTVKEMIQFTKERANAKPLPMLSDIPVILTGDDVKRLLGYYVAKSSGKLVYEGISDVKINDLIQGDEVTGDLINIKLVPVLENSSKSSPFDSDGILLKETTLYEDGVLKNYQSTKKFADYLNIKPTGNIGNIAISGGEKSIQELKNEPHLEILAFSDFQSDPVTGEFGGEIRLGRYYNGENTTIVSGGSMTGNINNVSDKMYFSKELQQKDNFVGPKSVRLTNVTISGN